MQFPPAKKSLGQNFLTSEGALANIISAAQVKEGDNVLEIGPGRGALTRELLAIGAKVTAIEKDRVLVPFLSDIFKEEIESGQLKLIEADILEFDLSVLEVPYKLIANIPYYITGQIFRIFLEGVHDGAHHVPISMTLLVQKEVAERIIAKDGKESILSLSVKAYGTPHYVSTVKRGSFNPAPNVDSAILHISDISKKFFTENAITEQLFFQILKATFAHKRKVISSNLVDKGFILPDTINKKARAEDLALDDFAEILRRNAKG
jgi:16S rRNA (adenine1518-N6/adenine1519-N6)-dimethyltransferase